MQGDEDGVKFRRKRKLMMKQFNGTENEFT